MNMSTGFAALALAAAAFGAPVAQKQAEVLFPYDLGPAAVDVSGYPAAEQGRYKVFAAKCGQCHTLARAINAPYVTREEWKRYVTRMHAHSKPLPWFGISRKEARAILDFLVFDAGERKVKQKAAFEAQAASYRCKLAQIQEARYCAQPAEKKPSSVGP